MSWYIKNEVVKTVDIKARARVIEFFLQVARHCEELRNYNALIGIVSSLNASPVHRLKATWKLVGGKQAAWKEEWDRLTLNNHVRLRDAQLQAELPCLPYLGVLLSDLTFIEYVPLLLHKLASARHSAWVLMSAAHCSERATETA